jgi:hypothetical protein
MADGLPWMQPQDWVDLYEMFDRRERAALLRHYLDRKWIGIATITNWTNRGIQHPSRRSLAANAPDAPLKCGLRHRPLHASASTAETTTHMPRGFYFKNGTFYFFAFAWCPDPEARL